MLDWLKFWKRPTPALRRYDALATAWDAAERPPSLLMSNEYQLFALMAWHRSEAARDEGIPSIVSDFALESLTHRETIHPGWYKRGRREYHPCSRCGGSEMLDDLWLCTTETCTRMYCRKCRPSARAPNGNYRDWCGGEIVWLDLPLEPEPLVSVSFRASQIKG